MPWPTDPDTEVLAAIDREVERQNTGIQLIASENFTSPAVMSAVGSVLTNKYSEGYPGKRYYGGNEFVDEVEDLARERVKALFGADHANVQPHSGAQANQAVFFAALQPGAKVADEDLVCIDAVPPGLGGEEPEHGLAFGLVGRPGEGLAVHPLDPRLRRLAAGRLCEPLQQQVDIICYSLAHRVLAKQ
jgi:hypothetical protein